MESSATSIVNLELNESEVRKVVIEKSDSISAPFYKSRFQFVIKKFDQYADKEKVTGEIEIPEINAQFSLEINPNSIPSTGSYSLSPEYMTCYHMATLSDPAKCLLTLKMSCEEFQDPNKYEVKLTVSSGNKVIVNDQKHTLKSGKFSIESQYRKKTFKDNVDSAGTLVVGVEISIFINDSSTSPVQIKNLFTNYKKLAEEHGEMLASSKFSDFKFIVKGKEFKVHRNILAVVSSVFASMFDSDMKEAKINECVVNDIDPDIFEHLLHFIYERKIPENLVDVAIKLFEVAHYYEVAELKEFCYHKIFQSLNTENASEMFEWASIYDEKLKMDSWRIIKRDILQIFLPMVTEPPAPDAVKTMIFHKQELEKLTQTKCGQKRKAESSSNDQGLGVEPKQKISKNQNPRNSSNELRMVKRVRFSD